MKTKKRTIRILLERLGEVERERDAYRQTRDQLAEQVAKGEVEKRTLVEQRDKAIQERDWRAPVSRDDYGSLVKQSDDLQAKLEYTCTDRDHWQKLAERLQADRRHEKGEARTGNETGAEGGEGREQQGPEKEGRSKGMDAGTLQAVFDERDELAERIERLGTEKDQLWAERNALRNEVNRLDEDTGRAVRARNRALERCIGAEERAREKEDRLTQLEEEQSKLSEERDALDRKLKNLRQELDRAHSHRAAVLDGMRLVQKERDTAQDRVRGLESRATKEEEAHNATKERLQVMTENHRRVAELKGAEYQRAQALEGQLRSARKAYRKLYELAPEEIREQAKVSASDDGSS